MMMTIEPPNMPLETLLLTWLPSILTWPTTSTMPPPPDIVSVELLPLTELPPETFTRPMPARMPPMFSAWLQSTWLPPVTETDPTATAIPPPTSVAVLEQTMLPPVTFTLPSSTTMPPPNAAWFASTVLAWSVTLRRAQMPPPNPVAV